MGLTLQRWQAHLQYWQPRFQNTIRQHWPAHVFRHEPLDNILNVLSSGSLLSRNAAIGQISNDVALEDIINCNNAAHDSVRLYFRPRNPTQYHIEGIRKQHEYYHGKHAGVLIVLVFDASDLITRADAQFSDGNMQSNQTNVYSNNTGFGHLDFAKIYHDTHSPDADTIRARCAEVLIPSPLNLVGPLRSILVRSQAERIMLVEKLQTSQLNTFIPMVSVVRQSGIFFNHYSGIEYVDIENPFITFEAVQRRDGQSIDLEIEVWDQSRTQLLSSGRNQNCSPATKYRWDPNLASGLYFLIIRIDSTLAFEGSIQT
ncbi:DarT ssDNA thymidine ADP-ribosyltransferase family protein [Pseudovibrio sp. POLY-S9]|uniref:DarT ssDNA thymidine ADP-ribosyltransferase family protein n=1 Tax=Pseudovibrio sp. POLY-S9 TaxID=1576596 RepID=UPI00070EDB38|nr:DarT ssDNA thymidine ADP-ribosyltransferase family protein [Pseudovibrio sp. POLY-S9]